MKWVPESVQWQREEWNCVTNYEGERAGKEGERTFWFRDNVNPHILDNIKVKWEESKLQAMYYLIIKAFMLTIRRQQVLNT